MRAINFFAICVAAIFFSGCAGYHLGPANGEIAGEKSIEIVPFNNQTLQPRLGDAVTEALRERMQADGTYHLATRNPGDVVVTGTITSYNRQGVSFLNNDVTTTEDYQIGIVAHVVARERDSGKVLLDKNISGSTFVHVGPELAESERQALPSLAEDLARNITESLTEGSW